MNDPEPLVVGRSGERYDPAVEPTAALLDLASSWPELHADIGDVIVSEGSSTDRLTVLVDGALEVRTAGEVVATIDQPGACIGEISLLLDHRHGASVVATAPSRLRVLDNASAVLADDATLLLPVAAILAARLRLVTTYLADLRHQYAGSGHGLGMVSEVLGSLTQHYGTTVDPGSEREPDAPY